MKKIIKKITAIALATTIILPTVSTPTAQAYTSNVIQPRLWPGRPGGNGDGSEEYLQGEYGEMNGPYRLHSTSYGSVREFNNKREKYTKAILNMSFRFIPYRVRKPIINTAVYAMPEFKGNYYKAELYISGRRSKLVITTYYDSVMNVFCDEYSEITRW